MGRGHPSQRRLTSSRPDYLRLLLCVSVLMARLTSANATPILDTGNPVGFFTNAASRLLSSELNLELTRIQIYPTNQYTPAVHRLLQVAANVFDTTSTNFYPSVFRPTFWVTNENGYTNVYINGYQQVVLNNSYNPITSDPQLALPLDVTSLLPGFNYPFGVNVYGVPWIIGAKKGFPNFNKFGMQNVVQITRKLQIARSKIPTTSVSDFLYTNQMYVFNISNLIGINCWNSYSNSYPNPVQIVVNDNLSMMLTSDAGVPTVMTNYSFSVNTTLNSSWPGSAWNPVVHNGFPSANSFIVPLNNTVVFLTNSAFYTGTTPPGLRGFYPLADNLGWETNKHDFTFPQFGLLTTNHLQVFMLDGNNVIDYVQFVGPESSRNLNAEFQTNGQTSGYGDLWSTNLNANGMPWGIMSQIDISDGNVPLDMTYWNNVAAPDEISGFREFMGYSPANNGSSIAQAYATNYIVQVPYSPTVTAYEYISWQANDPLVHYLASGLNFQGTENGGPTTGINVTTQIVPLPRPSFNLVNDRYQPWGRSSQMANIANVDPNPANLAFKDPLVRGSDYWNFPTNESSFGDWLGQIHRGTPWQTIYLKASNILNEIQTIGGSAYPIGTNTWINWTGDLDATDASAMAPVRDWQMASLLASMLNTNDLQSLFSVNNSNPNAWLVLLDGLTALTNDLPDSFGLSLGVFPPQFGTLVMSSNSPQVSAMVNAIQSARTGQPGQFFRDVGDILVIPQLTEQSPFLNWNDGVQSSNGISDEAYEIIPSQLLSLLRADSIGSIAPVNNQAVVQFTGYDGHMYAVQASSDLKNWTSISTNSPINGTFSFTITAPGNTGLQFYRSVLLQ